MIKHPFFESYRYELIKLVGKGSWGEVYEARDIKLNEIVAIKILNPTNKAKNQMKERELSLLEITIKETISLKNSANKYIAPRRLEYDNNDKEFLVMPLYKGDLRDFVKDRYYKKAERDILNSKNNFELDEIHEVMKNCAQGISEVHKDLGRAHGDIKPENFAVEYIDSSLHNMGIFTKALVLDLGTTSMYDPFNKKTKYRKNIGELYTRSPENFQGEAPTPKSDVWSLGSMYYKFLTGKYIFQDEIDSAENPEEWIKNLSAKEGNKLILKKLKENEKHIPNHLNYILKKTLNFKPLNRYQDAERLYEDLDAKIKKYEHKITTLGWIIIGKAALVLTMIGFSTYFKYQEYKKEEIDKAVQKIKEQEEIKYTKVHEENTERTQLVLNMKNNQYNFLSEIPYAILDPKITTIRIVGDNEYSIFGNNKFNISAKIKRNELFNIIEGFEDLDLNEKQTINNNFDKEYKKQKEELLNLNFFDENTIKFIDEVYLSEFNVIKNEYKSIYSTDSLFRQSLKNEYKNTSNEDIKISLEYYQNILYTYTKNHELFMIRHRYIKNFINTMKKQPEDYYKSFYAPIWYGERKNLDISQERLLEMLMEKGTHPIRNQEIKKFADKLTKEKIKEYFIEDIKNPIKAHNKEYDMAIQFLNN
jgi:serine/threonine protein kinase